MRECRNIIRDCKDPLFADKRYWPAIVSFFDRRNGAG